MPGTIRVSVFKCVDLPAEATGGKHVSLKVGMGKREFQTKPSNVDGNKTAVWNSDFAYPVLNLRDNLMVILLDNDGNAISQTEVLTPVIVEKGSLEELFPLKGGGRVHLKLSFVLTLEERMRIEAMRESALEKKERRIVKKNAIQTMKPLEEKNTSASDAAKDILHTVPENAKSKHDSQNEMNHITPVVANEHLMTTSLPNTKDTMKDDGDLGNSKLHESIDKFSMIEPGQSEPEKKETTLISADIMSISEVSSSQALLTMAEEIPAQGFLLHQENSALTSASSGSCFPPESSDSKGSANSAIIFTTGDKASDMPPEPISLVEVDGNANVLSVKTSKEKEMASSRLSTPRSVISSQSSTDGSMSSIPLVDSPNYPKGEASIPLANYFPGISQLDPVESSTQNSFNVASPSNTRSGSKAWGATEGICERSSLHTVATQSSSKAGGLTKSICSNTINLIDSRVKKRISTASSKPAASQAMKGSAVKAKIKAFESALSSETMREDGKRNSVKAKIRAFESNLTQDPDHHNASPRKTNHKIEAEMARQRLQEEAAAAQAAEAKRRAEEEELKLKGIAHARETNSGLPQKPSESSARTMVKLKRQYLERNDGEEKRETKEDVKDITLTKNDRKIHETYRGKEAGIWKLHEKWPEIGGTNIEQKELVKEPTATEMFASQISTTSEQKQDAGAQAGQSELDNHEPERSVAEARWIANEKAKQKHGSDHELIIDQRVHSVTPRDPFEEEASSSEKKLEGLVNDSAAFGGFIKQVVCAAALLATGALFMWMRGEKMTKRVRTSQPNYQPYLLPNDAATSKMDREGNDHPNSRISKRSKELLCP